MATWKELINDALEDTEEDFNSLVTTLSESELVSSFCDFWDSPASLEWTAWGKGYVYFPVTYDDNKRVGYAPRNPCEIKTKHWGNG